MDKKPTNSGSHNKWQTIPLLCLALLGMIVFGCVAEARAGDPAGDPAGNPAGIFAGTTQEDRMMAQSKGFSEKDLNGPTSFSFDGTVTLSINGTNVAVPVSAIGQVNWDGKGKASNAVRTFNFGGAVILQQVAEGEYQVNPDGTGSARFVVTTQGFTGTLPPGVELPPVAVETFSFVLLQPNELQFIGTGLFDQAGNPLAAVTVHGALHGQR